MERDDEEEEEEFPINLRESSFFTIDQIKRSNSTRVAIIRIRTNPDPDCLLYIISFRHFLVSRSAKYNSLIHSQSNLPVVVCIYFATATASPIKKKSTQGRKNLNLTEVAKKRFYRRNESS